MKKKMIRKPKIADFENEDEVLAEMAKELDIDASELKIERGSAPNGHGDAYIVSHRGPHGKEWCVVENEDAAHDIAVEGVKSDLDENPEYFNRNFIESHIDIERLKRDLYSDLHSSNYDYASEIESRRFWQEARRWGIEVPDEPRDPEDAEFEAMAEAMTEEQLKDPIEYLTDMLGNEEGMKEAVRIGGIDIDAAAEEAVSTDDEGHYLSSYDGNTSNTSNGFVYWRTN